MTLQDEPDFFEAFISTIQKLKDKYPRIIICCYLIIAHRYIDSSRPRYSSKEKGMRDINKALISKLLDVGFVDSARVVHEDKIIYTEYANRRMRESDKGCRPDYIFCSPEIANKVKEVFILPDFTPGSQIPYGIFIEE